MVFIVNQQAGAIFFPGAESVEESYTCSQARRECTVTQYGDAGKWRFARRRIFVGAYHMGGRRGERLYVSFFCMRISFSKHVMRWFRVS